MSTSTSARRKRNRNNTKNISPYNPAFGQIMIEQGVHPEGYRAADGSRLPKPNNVSEIQDVLAQPRPSLSPSKFSDSAFEDFQDANGRAGSESRVMTTVVPLIAGSSDCKYNVAEDISFSNMKKFHRNVTRPQPDLYYGTSASEIDKRVLNDIGEYILPSRNPSHPVAPNYTLACKAKSGNADVAQRQAMYDGAIGARVMHKLQNYGNKAPVYDGNAYSIAASYHNGLLEMYATHPAPPAERVNKPQYYTTRLGAYAMIHSSTTFRQGVAAYRNARDWTRQLCDRFIADANAVARQRSTQTKSLDENRDTGASADTEDKSGDSQTSTDEIALEHDSFAKRPRREASR